MDPITAPEVHNLSWEKEQPTLKLDNKFYFRSLCRYSWSAINHSCHWSFCFILEAYAGIHDQRLTIHASDFAETYTLKDDASPSSKRRLHTKVTMANFIFVDRARKQNLFNFLHAYTTDLGTIFIITPSYTSICWCNPSLDWDYKIVRNLPRVHVELLPLLTKQDWGAPLLGLAKSLY